MKHQRLINKCMYFVLIPWTLQIVVKRQVDFPIWLHVKLYKPNAMVVWRRLDSCHQHSCFTSINDISRSWNWKFNVSGCYIIFSEAVKQKNCLNSSCKKTHFSSIRSTTLPFVLWRQLKDCEVTSIVLTHPWWLINIAYTVKRPTHIISNIYDALQCAGERKTRMILS